MSTCSSDSSENMDAYMPASIKSLKTHFTIGSIKSLLKTTKRGKSIISEEFSTDSDTIQWSLRLYPNGCSETKEEGYMSLYLEGYCGSIKQKKCINFYIFDNKNKRWYPLEALSYEMIELGQTRIEIGPKFISKNFVLDESKHFVKNDQVQIMCEILDDNGEKQHQQMVLDDFQRLLDSKLFSDVRLIVDGKEFSAHKNILSLRSSVFMMMFENDMMERNESIVRIQDTEPEVFEQLLQYMYVGDVKNIQPFVNELLAAADKYDVQGLKKMCECFISNNVLCCSNAVELLEFALFYNANYLKSKAICCIKVNIEKIIKTKVWDSAKLPLEVVKDIMSELRS